MNLNAIMKKPSGESDPHNSLADMDIAVIGMAAKLPDAESIDEFWHNLRKGRNSVHGMEELRKRDVLAALSVTDIKDMVPVWNQTAFLDRIDVFDYQFFGMSYKEAQLMDPSQRLFLQIAWLALEDSGYGGKRWEGTDTGVYVAVSSSYTQAYKSVGLQLGEGTNAFFVSGMEESMIGSRIAFLKNFHGPSMIIECACSSSLVCMHTAIQAIHNGDCTQAIVGGVNLRLLPVAEKGSLGINSPDGITRSFDAMSTGTGAGEGAVAFVIKPATIAVRDGDEIYAVIKGGAVNQSGRALSLTSPNPEAQAEVIVKAWKAANIRPEELAFIEAHGTGTEIGDPIEVEGLRKAFSMFTDRKQFCGLGSVKSNIGHLGNLAGLAGLLKLILCIYHKTLVPTVHFEYPNPKIPIHATALYISDQCREWPGTKRIGAVSSFGLSGTNCHMVVGQCPALQEPVPDDAAYDILAVSAASLVSLRQLLCDYLAFLQASKVNLHDFCFTANVGRDHYRYRAAFICKNCEELRQALQQVLDLGIDHMQQVVQTDVAAVEELAILQQLKMAYHRGEDIDWLAHYDRNPCRTIHIPAYRFEKTRCWYDIPDQYALKASNEHLYNLKWVRSRPVTLGRQTLNTDVIFLSDTDRQRDPLYAIFSRGDITMPYARIGSNCIDNGDCDILIDARYASMERFVLNYFQNDVHRVLFSVSQEITSLDELKEYIKSQYTVLFNLTSVLEERRIRVTIFLLLKNVFSITGEEIVNPSYAMLFSFSKSMNLENMYVDFCCIDYDDHTSADHILGAVNHRKAGDKKTIALRQGWQYAEHLCIEYDDKAPRVIPIRDDGAYVVTGGLGRVGRKVCKHLVATHKIRLYILARTPVSDDSDACQFLHALRSNGSQVVYFPVDIADPKAVASVLQIIKSESGSISGVIHSAGITKPGRIVRGRTEIDEEFFIPKVYGSWVLDRLCENEPLDFFIVFSSFITAMGGEGTSEYAAANAYLDSLIEARLLRGKSALSIHWTTIMDETMTKSYDQYIFKPMEAESAMSCLEQNRWRNQSNLFIGELNFEKEYYDLRDYLPFYFDDEIIRRYQKEQGEGSDRDIRVTGKAQSEYTETERIISHIIGNLLGIDEIDIHQNCFELGVNSILAVQIEMKAKKMGLGLRYANLYEYGSIAELAEYLEQTNHASREQSSTLLLDMEPFDSFFYRDCIYSSIFPCLRYLGCEMIDVLIHDIPVYELSDNSALQAVYLSDYTYKDVMEHLEIKACTEGKVEPLIPRLVDDLTQLRPVILWVDSFYEPFIADVFQKRHLQHSVLVYGFDEQKQIFHVIDHNNSTANNYAKRTIGYRELEDSYYSQFTAFSNAAIDNTYICMENRQGIRKDLDTRRSVYLDNIQNHEHEIVDGFDVFAEYIESFLHHLTAGFDGFLRNGEDILQGINSIIQGKKACRYIVGTIFSESQALQEIVTELVNQWDGLRGQIVRILYVRTYTYTQIEKIRDHMKRISKADKEWLNVLRGDRLLL